VNYARFDGDIGQFNTPTISLGYEFSKNSLSLIPEVRYGNGGNGYQNNIELDKFLAFSIKGQWNFQTGLYLFLYPSYSNTTLKKTSSSSWYCCVPDEKKSSWGFGAGVGGGFKITDNFAIETAFEKSNDYDFFALGLRYNF